jgi:hypothetical protein
MKRRTLLMGLLLAACAERPAIPPTAEGGYQLDYAGVYGTGRIALVLHAGKVNGLNAQGAGPSYRGFYRQAKDPRQIELDLIAHLPPIRQIIDGVAVIGTARDIRVQFAFPADLGIGQYWPVRIETQAGRITGEITRLP